MTRRLESAATTVPALLAAAADVEADRDAFVDRGHRLSFGGWDRAADGVAALFADHGVGRGDVVCLMLSSSAEYAICYQAAMRLGAITSGVNLRLGPGEKASIAGRTKPVVTVLEVGADAPPGSGVLIDRDTVCEAAAGGARPARRPALSRHDPVAVVWTSGTTGVPKGAVFDHDNLRAVADGAGVLSEPGDRRLSPLPFAHVGFMTRPWDEIAHLITTVIVPAPWTAAEALRLIGEERVTVAQGVPTQWSLMLAHPAFATTDTSHLRLAGTGASPVPPDLVRALRQRLGCPVIVRYTSTEASLTTGTRPGDPDEVLAETVGAPSDGVEVQVVDDLGRPVPTGEVGTVRCRSGAVMRGYWNDPKATAKVLSSDGWLLTGDLGRFDHRGYLTLVGRRSEMYIRGGYNVHPAEVEAVLSSHPAVDRIAVVGMPDPVLGEIGVAVVVAAPGQRVDLAELRRWCQTRLADYKIPDRLVAVDDLPLTSMSKVDKQALGALAAAASAPE